MSAFSCAIDQAGIAVLTFDLHGEKVNKLTTPAMDELDRILDELAADQKVKALVVRSGKPAVFVAGADIAEIRDITDAARGEELSRRGQEVMNKLEALPFPTVAAIHGACMGGGLELALACSRRVVSNHATTVFGLPEVKIGIIPGFGGTQRLPRLVGLTNALEMILTGKSVPAKKAKKIGLADEVTYPEMLLDVAVSMAKEAIGRPRPSGIRATRPLFIKLLESTPLTRSLIYRRARRSVAEETRGNYPAPPAALEAVQYGLAHGRSAGYQNEARTIGGLIASGVSKNLINVFFLNEALKKYGQPSSFATARTGVIGAGVMGGGIAQLFAEKGFAVRMKDITPKAVAAGFRTADEIFRKRSKKGILDTLQARDGMDRITGTTDMSGFAGVDLAVEAVVENREVKKNVLREFEQTANARAIFASNTSSLSITELATASARPGQVVGMHFFNPVEKMPLVEVVRGKQTSPETVAAVAALSRRLGKLPVVVNDGPGFLVNRILMPYLGEALRMLEEGSRIEEIDHALLNFGMPMGAFILLDEIGIDIAHKVSGILREGLGERITASPLLEKLYQNNFYGRKNGRGFYLYLHGKRGGASPLVYSFLPKRAKNEGWIPEQEIVERAVFLMIKEAVLCLEAGIIDRPDLLDAALIFGIGFPPFRGGLLRYAESLGAKYIVERLDAYAAQYGDRFAPPASLFEMSRDDFIGQIVG
ncbi:MAG: fatty acid oxidation complex subunit alpha FadJ [Nitrospirae bacterium]|nr:fatty acid oxidation complex subunit alpha FadJ [Nitrospirota bacterium]NTW67417.1 fatty acid oxidation complex subunit alpha FadJ [Nitrospirota bacterium]